MPTGIPLHNLQQEPLGDNPISGKAYPADTRAALRDAPMISPYAGTKPYIGAKVIRAKPMTQEEWLKSQGKYQENQESYGDGYEVTYPDNYKSWSPKKVFETAYREIELSEIGLIIN